MSTEVLVNKTEAIQKLYELFGQGNIPAIVESLSENVVWNATRNPFLKGNRVYTGRTDVLNFFKEVGETLVFHLFEPLNYFETGNKLFVIGRTS